MEKTRRLPVKKDASIKRAPFIQRSDLKSYAFIAPYFILFFIFTVLPVLISIILSFTNFNLLETPRFVGAQNYERLFFGDDLFIRSIGNTFLLALITGPLGYLLCLFFAWFINELRPGIRALVTLIFYAPSISGNVYLVWQVMFSGDSYGYINGLLMNLGLISQPILWLQDPRYMIYILALVGLWASLGAGFLSFVAGFQGIDRSYYEAAAMDGIKNRWQELWYVTLPAIRPQMLFGAVMSITGAFNVGAIGTVMMGFPSTDYATHTMINHLEDYGTTRFEMGYASAIATVLFLTIILSNMAIRRLLSKVGT